MSASKTKKASEKEGRYDLLVISVQDQIVTWSKRMAQEAEIIAIPKKQPMKSGFQAKALRQRESNSILSNSFQN